jgi:hypothetical protein
LELIAERLQIAGQLVVINIFGELSGAQEFIILKRLPAILHLIKCGIEHNAMCVQMRVEGA